MPTHPDRLLNTPPSWSRAAAAGVVALWAGLAAGRWIAAVGGFEPHADLVVGEITFSGLAKAPDLTAAGVALLAFPLALWAIHGVALALTERNGARGAFDTLLILCVVPMLLWLGGTVLGQPFIDRPAALSLAALSLSVTALAVLTATVGAAAAQRPTIDGDTLFALCGRVLLIGVLAAAAMLAALTMLGRLRPLWGPALVAVTPSAIAAALGLSLLGTAWAWIRAGRDPERIVAALDRLVRLLQVPLALGFFALIEPSWAQGEERLRPNRPPAILLAAVGLLCVASWAMLARAKMGPAPTGLSVAALVVLLRLGLPAPQVFGMDNPGDHYHYGEWSLPWHQLSRHGVWPYIDLSPSHGLLSHLDGMMGALFGDGTLATAGQGRLMLRATGLILAALALTALAGPVPAAFGLVLMPLVGRHAMLLMALAVLAVLALPGLWRRPSLWLLAFGLLGLAIVLLAPSQGSAVVLAALPFAVWQLVRGWALERGVTLGVMAFGAALAVGLLLSKPGAVILALVGFIVENRAIYGAVHGIPVADSIALAWPVNPVFWEILRHAWFPGLIALAILLWAGLKQADADLRQRCLVFAGAAVLFVLILIPHTIGRIDPGGPSRPGAQSAFVLALLVPVAASLALTAQRRVAVFAVAAFGLGALLPAFRAGFDPGGWLAIPAASRPIGDRVLIDGAAHGLPRLGRGYIAPGLVAELAPLKQALDRILAPGETYLDLSDRNADYVYLDRPVPIESGAAMTLPATAMQQRSRARLDAQPPAVVLLGMGGAEAGHPFPASLRAHLVYRHVVERVARGELVGLQAGAASLLVDPRRVPDHLGDARARLDRAFRRADLGRIPQVWGASAAGLERDRLIRVRALDGAAEPGNNTIREGADFVVTGPDPGIRIDITPGIDGRDAGILRVELSCLEASAAPLRIELYWRHAGKAGFDEDHVVRFHGGTGVLLVPLDAAPRWLLGGLIERLRFDIADPAGCARLRLNGLGLWQRSALAPSPAGGAR